MSDQATRRRPDAGGYSVEERLARPGAVTYLHIPATDVRRAAAFYRDVFAWPVDRPESDRPGFRDARGDLSGAWIGDGPAGTEPRLVLYIYVADVQETVARILDHGGAMVTDPYSEGRLTVATFRDPAGNVLGLWHDTTRPRPASAPSGGPTVAPVPEHLRTVTARLVVADGAAAIDFYLKAFAAQEIGERHSAPDGTLIHAQLQIGDSVVMVTAGDGYKALLCTYWPDVDAAWERAVGAGARVLHPLADQFYGERGGRLIDPFGQEWMLSARREKLTAAEISARARAQT
ncbi:MAG TPA: VOC family protein [Solirubrobacteraceae bacterium]|nr:VOC family protein [Solirubrobacteraceae bacterium]